MLYNLNYSFAKNKTIINRGKNKSPEERHTQSCQLYPSNHHKLQGSFFFFFKSSCTVIQNQNCQKLRRDSFVTCRWDGHWNPQSKLLTP